MKTIAIVDYGVGNLKSVSNALAYLGLNPLVTGDAGEIEKADALILPGVGAFGDAAALLRQNDLDKLVCQEAAGGKPLLGICLGMQLLFDYGLEYGRHEGLGLIHGSIQPIADYIPAGLKIPHIGWNALRFPVRKPVSPLFKHVKEGDCVYFVHSFCGTECEESVIASAEYGAMLTAAVGTGQIYGVQFHPEKSGATGLRILQAFCEL